MSDFLDNLALQVFVVLASCVLAVLPSWFLVWVVSSIAQVIEDSLWYHRALNRRHVTPPVPEKPKAPPIPLAEQVTRARREALLARAEGYLRHRGTHKHHGGTDGTPEVFDGDLFVLVKNPLGQHPEFYAGHFGRRGHRFTTLRDHAKKFNYQLARNWTATLSRLGHDVWIAVYDEIERNPARDFRQYAADKIEVVPTALQ